MNYKMAGMILSCTTNAQLSALHDYFELEMIPNPKSGLFDSIKGKRLTIYYGCPGVIKSLSIAAAILKPGGRIC